MTKFDLHETVTNRIIESIEKGVLPWVKPWNSQGMAHNIVTKKPYKGINTILTAMNSFQSSEYATALQWAKLGYKLKEGESRKATMIIFNSKIEKEEMKEGKKVKSTFWINRFYNVYNAEQIQDYKPQTSENPAFNPIEKCESVLSQWENFITYTKGDKAFYAPSMDIINMPARENFKTSEGFYSTAFHELAHLTGHESRLNRLDACARFGSESDAFEELVAELASAFINHACGLDSIQNHDSYIASWLKVLKNDKKAIFKASSLAVKASDLILGNNEEKDDQE